MTATLLAHLTETLGPRGFTTDPDAMAPWLTDWRGRFKGRAQAMVSPANTGEVVTVVRLARQHGVAIVPQGGNTSMVGGATPSADGSALLLSTRRMNRIRSLSAENGVTVAEAGVILSDLHDAAEAVGFRFPLSLGAKGSATIGGLASTNAGGTQVLRFGTMRALVLGIEAVLPDGTRIDGLAPLKKDNRGYDLRHLLIGAEGTLGVITAASLRLVPQADEVATAWVGLAGPAAALDLLRTLEGEPGFAVESFELLPAQSLASVLRHIPATRAPLASEHGWHVLIDAAGQGGAGGALQRALEQALETGRIENAALATSTAAAAAFWRIRDSISEAERASGPAAQHDISVPVASMPRFMIEAAAEVEAAFPGVSASGFGHLGDGNVHFHVRAPDGAGPDWLAVEGPPITRMVDDLVTAVGGSISAEHGIGQMKLDEFVRLAEPGRIPALQAIKSALDPGWMMNPGKLVPSPGSS